MNSRIFHAAAIFSFVLTLPAATLAQQQDENERSDFDGMPHFREEIVMNRAIFSAAPLALTVCGCAVAVENWTPIQMIVAGGVGVLGTGISYYHQFIWLPKRTHRIPPKAAMVSMGIGLATAACAAMIANLIH